MPGPDASRNLWYSFNWGNVHFVLMCVVLLCLSLSRCSDSRYAGRRSTTFCPAVLSTTGSWATWPPSTARPPHSCAGCCECHVADLTARGQVVFSGHRPMYDTSSSGPNYGPVRALREALEPVLIKYNVRSTVDDGW
jgi:hypothetical protein